MLYRSRFTEESSFMGWLIAVSRAFDLGDGVRCVKCFTGFTAISCAIQEAALGCSTTTLCGGGSTIDRKRFDQSSSASRFSSR